VHYKNYNKRLFIGFAAVIVILVGCAPRQKPPEVSPVRKSLAEVLSDLSSRSESAPPFKANGGFRLQYYIDDKKYKQGFPMKLWVNPPDEIYLQGDIVFDPQGLVAGSNKYEFWLAIKPKEISSFWWGQWQGQNFPQRLMFSPKKLLEALGLADIHSGQNWTSSGNGPIEVLTKQNEQGTVIRKIHISNPDCLVKTIEYFDDNGIATAITELDEYKSVLQDFSVPTVTRITKLTGSDTQDSVEITLGSIKPVDLTDKQRRRLFTRPEPLDFKHIYRIIDGNIIEQKQ